RSWRTPRPCCWPRSPELARVMSSRSPELARVVSSRSPELARAASSRSPECTREAGMVDPRRAWPASFADRLTAPLPGFRDMARILRSGGFTVKDRSDAARIPVAAQERLPTVHGGQTAVTWIGHATYVVQLGGLTILTDPVWSNKIPGVSP